MGDKTGIGWTEATWNPVVGCSIVSAGCTNCYAMKQAGRIVKMTPGSHYDGTVKDSKAGPVWTGVMKKAPARILEQPLRWTEPRMIFANSMSDLFHEDIPDEWIDEAFAVMHIAHRHTFQILTKRSERMRRYIEEDGRLLAIAEASLRLPPQFLRGAPMVIPWPLPNVWMGVSAEDQRAANERIPNLLETSAAVRFVSYEPAIGPIDFAYLESASGSVVNALTGDVATALPGGVEFDEGPKLDWIIIGGESHRQREKARQFHLDWARETVAECRNLGVSVFMKQLGSNPVDTAPDVGTLPVRLSHRKGEDQKDWPESIRVQQYPAKVEADG